MKSKYIGKYIMKPVVPASDGNYNENYIDKLDSFMLKLASLTCQYMLDNDWFYDDFVVITPVYVVYRTWKVNYYDDISYENYTFEYFVANDGKALLSFLVPECAKNTEIRAYQKGFVIRFDGNLWLRVSPISYFSWLENKDYKGVYNSADEKKKSIISPARMIKKKKC